MYDFNAMDKRLIIFANIFLTANRLQTLMDRELKEITAKQWLALIMLDAFPEPPTLKELSAMCNTSHQNTKQIVLKLEANGYVRTQKDERDGRAIRIYKAPLAERLWAKYGERSQRFIEEMFSPMDKTETMALYATQAKLYRHLQCMETTPAPTAPASHTQNQEGTELK